MASVWKTAEARLAKLFGAKRRPLSGGNSAKSYGDDTGTDDIVHDVIYGEAKYLENGHQVWNFYLAVRRDAILASKVPVCGFFRKNEKGFLLLFHTNDLDTVVREYLEAQGLKAVPIEETESV